MVAPFSDLKQSLSVFIAVLLLLCFSSVSTNGLHNDVHSFSKYIQVHDSNNHTTVSQSCSICHSSHALTPWILSLEWVKQHTVLDCWFYGQGFTSSRQYQRVKGWTLLASHLGALPSCSLCSLNHLCCPTILDTRLHSAATPPWLPWQLKAFACSFVIYTLWL